MKYMYDQPDTLEELHEMVEALNRGVRRGNGLMHRMKTNEAAVEWVKESVLFLKDGDRARISSPFAQDLTRDSGWYSYRECLAVGAEGTVHDVSFNDHHGIWQASFQPDKVWSVHEREGMPKSELDPDGKRRYHDDKGRTFFLQTKNLTRIEEDKSV